MVDLEGYVILVVQTFDGRTRIYGSPADRADLEVGDEIVEVNGHTLEGASHAEVISHIHRCIKSRTIQLRVKRSSSDNLGPGLNDIQDAYVIAVEEQARARLEQLSSMHKVQPVDITRLSQLANLDLGAEGDKSARIYVTANNNIGSTATLGKSSGLESQDSEADGECDQCSEKSDAFSEKSDNSEDQLLEDDGPVVVDDSMETAVMNGYVNGHSNGPLPQDPRYISVNMSGGNMITNPPPYDLMDQGRQRSKEHVYEDVDISAEESDPNDSGPHREMAIDCPANFVGSKKERPSYPPPPNARNSPRNTPPYGTPVKRVEEGSQHGFVEPAPPVMADPPQMSKDEQLEYNERKRKYQEDLQKRREQEERMAREQEFLRNSLRGSEKLKALQEIRADLRPTPAGIVNPNYLVEEDETEKDSSAPTSRASTLPLRTKVDIIDGSSPRLLGADDLLNSLGRVQGSVGSLEDKKDIASVSRLFQNPRFQQALAVHNKVVEVSMRQPQPNPVCDNGQELCTEVLGAMPAQPPHPHMEELCRLLRGPNMKAILLAHDKVAKQKSAPATTTTDDDEREYLYERASQYNEDSIKIVRLQKTADPLGATVRNEGESVIVGRIVKGGAAEKSGLLHEGDEILEINGIDIRGKSVNDVCDLMANMTGTLTFLIVPREEFPQPPLEPTTPTSIMMHIKAHFNYDPEDDLYIPCRELGISFLKGDILHVINQEDPNWWQAYREGEDDQALAGLIPSKTFQEHREAMKQTIVGDSKETPKKKGKCRCRKHNKKKKKQLYNAASEELDAEEILTYEEVALYYPQPSRKRPIVLIGPPNVGRHELRQKLMESDIDRFAAAIPHTSRPRKDDETDGKDYHFVPRHVFEADITGHRFVEYGEFEKNLYGTSLDAIRQVVNAGKICVLNLYPQSLRILKASDLKPYVVFVAPPNLERLKQIRKKQTSKVTDDELKDIIEKAREMEENYGHYFDLIIVNFDLGGAYEELVAEINRLEVEPQWVPAQWVT